MGRAKPCNRELKAESLHSGGLEVDGLISRVNQTWAPRPTYMGATAHPFPLIRSLISHCLLGTLRRLSSLRLRPALNTGYFGWSEVQQGHPLPPSLGGSVLSC